jgi:hypothetical protein
MAAARLALGVAVTLVLSWSPLPLRAQQDSLTIGRAQALLGQQRWDDAARVLNAITDREPDNARAWAMLGFALHSAGDYESALAAHVKATEFPQTAPNASYNAAMAHARLGNADEAFAWLEKASATGRVDLTQIGLDPDAESLRADPRYRTLLPTKAEFAAPFVEPVTIVHDWHGEATNDQFGWIARNIGDVDGDGVNDVTTSAPTNDEAGNDAGKVYTYSGKTGTLVWSVTGPEGGQLGLGIEAAGDVDADGIPDVIAGAPPANTAFIYSGRDGSVLRVLEGEDPNDAFGRKVADVGDLDGDGHAEVLVGAPGVGEGKGRAYVYSGSDGAVLHTWDGENAGDGFGSAGAGRAADGDVFIVVGAPNAGEADRGRTYVYRGLVDTPAFVIESDDQGTRLGGMFVSVIGDVDGDGTQDVYASDWAHRALGPTTGRVYVHSGATGERLLTLTGEAAGDGFGIGPADAGDVNGDGHDDLVIGAWRQANAAPMGGKIYVYSGSDGALLREITGKVMGETLGFDATGMGDVDGDGAIDYLVTSAWSAINGTRSGRMYVLSGRAGPD